MASTSSKTPSLSSSSSSSSIPRSKYDVFLSFRGEDTGHGFTDHLYEAFRSKGIEAFRDSEKFQLGQEIASELVQAIENSQYAIVVFSEKYADSRWCLDELAEIVECKKNKGLQVVPVFYHVYPSDVRKQTGPFEKAFDEHQSQRYGRIDRAQIQKWKHAMREVGKSSSGHLLLPRQRSEAECIQDIVKVIFNKLNFTFSPDTKGLIGIESRVDKLKSHLAIGSNDVRIIGIWGLGGMGKTTLARVVYDMISNQFEACCFIANIGQVHEMYGLVQLQRTLLSNLLMLKDLKVQDVGDGVLMIKNRLCNKKILLVLDDVNELNQLKNLVGEHCWFGSGSRVMITTKDKMLLEMHEVNDIYEVEVLNDDEALQLFSLKAFKNDHPAEDYIKLSQAFVDYSKGLPLAIEVLGSSLFKKSICVWKSELDRLREIPNRTILNVLRLSFDGLEEIEKETFLNIACFFNHMDQDHVIEILDFLQLYPRSGLWVLIKKSLLKLHWNQLWMHDLLRDMGWNIVRQECPGDPGKRSRLWLDKDIYNVLTKNAGTASVEGIVLNLPKLRKAYWNPESFLKMQHLKLLIINNVHLMHDLKHLSNDLRYLDWRGYSSKSLPSSFQSNELIELHMCCSYIERLWKGIKGHSLDDRHLHKRYAIIFPRSEIPKWFRHQSIGAEVNIKEHFSHLCNEWMGIAVCVVFCSHPYYQIPNGDSLSCWLVVNGKKMSSAPNTGHIFVLSDHIWLLYLLPQYYQEKQIKLLWECDANGFIRVGIRIMAHCSIFKVKRCGFRMVYKKDIEDVNQSMAQCSNNSIIPYKGLNDLHHKFGNAKRTRDDYDGAGPNGEGSSNDVPDPKRIVRSQLSTENVVRS